MVFLWLQVGVGKGRGSGGCSVESKIRSYGGGGKWEKHFEGEEDAIEEKKMLSTLDGMARKKVRMGFLADNETLLLGLGRWHPFWVRKGFTRPKRCRFGLRRTESGGREPITSDFSCLPLSTQGTVWIIKKKGLSHYYSTVWVYLYRTSTSKPVKSRLRRAVCTMVLFLAKCTRTVQYWY